MRWIEVRYVPRDVPRDEAVSGRFWSGLFRDYTVAGRNLSGLGNV